MKHHRFIPHEDNGEPGRRMRWSITRWTPWPGSWSSARRPERALHQVVVECCGRGVPTRTVDGLIKTLGIEAISPPGLPAREEPGRPRGGSPIHAPGRGP